MSQTRSVGDTTIRTGRGDDTVLGFACFPCIELLADGGAGNNILMFENTSTMGAIFRGATGNDLFGWQTGILLPVGVELEFDGAGGTDQHFNGPAVSPLLRRMEGAVPGDYTDILSIATTRDQFYVAGLLWLWRGREG